MKQLRISEAKMISERVGADAVVVLAFKDDVISSASYGHNKAQCATVGRWMDKLIDDIADGRIAAPLL